MDGNTAALNAYQREQDALDDQDNALLAAQQELSNDLFDGYFEGNMACVDSVEDFLFDNIDVMNNLLKKMRESFMGRPADPRIAYKSAIIENDEPVYMNPNTGSVDFASGWDEAGGIAGVARSVEEALLLIRG